VDKLLVEWGVKRSKLNAKEVTFVVADFSTNRDPKEVFEEVWQQVSYVASIGYTAASQEGYITFNVRYPGVVVVFIGAERIPPSVDVFNIRIITKKPPTVFIIKEVIKTYPNRDVQEAFWDNISATSYQIWL
jgi:hypothetical protein